MGQELNYERIITELGNRIAQLNINEAILLSRLKDANDELEQLRNEVYDWRRKNAESQKVESTSYPADTTTNQPVVNGGNINE